MTDIIIEELRAALPPVWLGTRSGELSGWVFHWPSIQNMRSKRLIPAECFARAGNRTLVRRDPFLRWFASTLLSDARRPPVVPPRRGRPQDAPATIKPAQMASAPLEE